MPTLRPAAGAAARHKTPTRAGGECDPLDWFVEPSFAVRCLFDVIPLRGNTTVLDPHAGLGTIPKVCRDLGLIVTGSDLAERGVPGVTGGVDFLSIPPYPPRSFDWVITNPPYYGGRGPICCLAAASRIARKGVALLVNLPFLASQGRWALFNNENPEIDPEMRVDAVVILSKRPSMPPGEVILAGHEAKGGKEDYAWVVWRRDPIRTAPPTIHWVMPLGAPREGEE